MPDDNQYFKVEAGGTSGMNHIERLIGRLSCLTEGKGRKGKYFRNRIGNVTIMS